MVLTSIRLRLQKHRKTRKMPDRSSIKDFFNFTHEYLFDEIFTNMPFAAGKTTQQEIVQLYEQFFKKIPSLLTKEGKVILYTHNATEAKKIAAKNSYKLLAAFPYRNKPRTDLLIFSR